MISKRIGLACAFLVTAVLLAPEQSYGQETYSTVDLQPSIGSSMRVSRDQARTLYVGQYGFSCTAHVWTEGEIPPWIYAYVELSADSVVIDTAWASGYWDIWATAIAWIDVTPYDQYVSCVADTSGGSPNASVVAPGVPEGETIESYGWDGGGFGDSVHRWVQTLTPSSGYYGGRITNERDGGGGNDTCYFPGSEIMPFNRVSGSSGWQVDTGNRWGPDRVGWLPAAVIYYRDQGRAPCDTSFYQNMVIDVWGSELQYITQRLAAGITSISVWSRRADHEVERIWP